MLQGDRNQIVHPARGALISWNNQLKRAILAQWSAVASVGHDDLICMKVGIDFGERKNHGVSVGAGGGHVGGHRLAAQGISHGRMDLG